MVLAGGYDASMLAMLSAFDLRRALVAARDARAIRSGSLMGARGSSGVIVAQLATELHDRHPQVAIEVHGGGQRVPRFLVAAE